MKSAKFHMSRIIGKAHLTFEEMTTVLCGIEAVLISRPITQLSNDPNDLMFLSPGHFWLVPRVQAARQNENGRMRRWPGDRARAKTLGTRGFFVFASSGFFFVFTTGTRYFIELRRVTEGLRIVWIVGRISTGKSESSRSAFLREVYLREAG